MAMERLFHEPDAVLPAMKPEEARACVDAIKAHDSELRRELMSLYERRGWVALGYTSLRECMVNEFGQSQAYLYRQLEAAHTERAVSPMGETSQIPERQLRPLTTFRSDPGLQRETWQAIQETAPERGVTAKHSASVVQAVRDAIDEGIEPREALNHVIETHRLPRPVEAELLAHETGLLVVGSDGRYHDGSSDADKAVIANEQRQRFAFFSALETLSEIPESPMAFAKCIRPDQYYRIEESLDLAVEWLTKFQAAWSVISESPV